MKIKRLVLTTLLILWMIVIFVFSSQPANISEGTSDRVTSQIIDTYSNLTDKKISDNKKKNIIDEARFLVRKTAHFTSYFILNLIAYFTLKSYGIKRCLVYSIILSFLFACTDEIHQVFVYERAGRVLDVIIDTTGAITSALVITCFKLIFKRKIKDI